MAGAVFDFVGASAIEPIPHSHASDAPELDLASGARHGIRSVDIGAIAIVAELGRIMTSDVQNPGSH